MGANKTTDGTQKLAKIRANWCLCGRASDKAAEALKFGDVTNMLELPLWPVYGAIFAGMALCALVFAVRTLSLLMGRTND
ncbi:hypothetical protein [Donghicola eburneus]|uniref:hypothetical protein n=1 Tax=Donghicola eburneus TaxID=393278 RepID=UPI0008E3180A|nr:hypothetical protein [Donghicola eburneus]SFQ78550.1 hypothetical protein SAMN05421764_12319 [Donghicola eburneus]